MIYYYVTYIFTQVPKDQVKLLDALPFYSTFFILGLPDGFVAEELLACAMGPRVDTVVSWKSLLEFWRKIEPHTIFRHIIYPSRKLGFEAA